MVRKDSVSNVNIIEMTSLINPGDFKEEVKASDGVFESIAVHRKEVQDILSGKDDRLMAIVGPCSIHDEKAALEFAHKLLDLKERLSDRFLFIMRVYFEKPRTTIGWKGLITDPHLDGSFNVLEGLTRARGLMIQIAEMGLPIGSEILDPIIPQYISDLISWASIGARTTESQVHREIASGLSMPVGFKNSTDGKFSKALNAIESSYHPHNFIGIDEKGLTSICRTRGNHYGHLILRGGDNGPNYYEELIEEVETMMEKRSMASNIMIDCSHANSGKKYYRQERVLQSVIEYKKKGHGSLKGFMLESNLFEGNQPILEDISELKYGVSITDACLSWQNTEEIIINAYNRLLT